MSYSSLLIVMFTMLSTLGISQNSKDPAPINWGEVSKEDFNLGVPDFSPDATTLTICKYGQVSVARAKVGSPITKTDVHERFIILTEEGIGRANIGIPFYTGMKKGKKIRKLYAGSYTASVKGQTIENVKANVFNLDADSNIVKTTLKDDQIFVSDYSDAANYGVVTLALPNIKVGTVVEYRYTISENRVFNTKVWYFQSDDPCLHNEIRFHVIDNTSYAVIHKGLLGSRITMEPSYLSFEDYYRIDGKVYKYELDSIPALLNEPYVASMDNYLTHVMIQISKYYDYTINRAINVISTWDKLSDEFYKSPKFWKQIKRNKSSFTNLEYVHKDAQNLENKLQLCYDYVRDYFDCNNRPSVMVSQNLDDVYETSVGSAVEINLFLCGLLNQADIDAKMALVSTRNNGVVNVNYPFVDQFNHAICVAYIEDEVYFLDASVKDGSYNFPPENIIGCKAFIITQSDAKFIEIKSDGIYDKYVMISENIDEDSIHGKMRFRYKGYAASAERMKAREFEDLYIYNSINSMGKLYFSDSTIINMDTVEKPLIIHLDYSMEHGYAKIGDLIYINPFNIYGDFVNDLKSDDRYFPVEFKYPINVTYLYSIKLPEGYVVESTPENSNKALQNNVASVTFFYQQVGNSIQIKTQLKINKPLFLSYEYNGLKTLFEEWELKHNELVVLKKGNN